MPLFVLSNSVDWESETPLGVYSSLDLLWKDMIAHARATRWGPHELGFDFGQPRLGQIGRFNPYIVHQMTIDQIDREEFAPDYDDFKLIRSGL